MLNQKKKAFTLIELLVVIAIIGILATLAVVALQQARQNARDSKRMADMKQVHTALELFYNENNRYPTQDEWNSGTIISSSSQEIFMYNIPSAPTPADGDCQDASNTYTYIPLNEGASYTIDFCTGKQVSDLPQGVKQMTPGGIIFGSSGSGGGETPTWSCGDNFTDTRDGNVYPTVQIGTQCWFAKNLAYLPAVHGPNTGWSPTTEVKYAVYDYTSPDNLVEDAKATDNYQNYGVLYNWYAVNQSGENTICSPGWHVPTNVEWTELIDYLGGSSVAGGKMKQTGTIHWNSPNEGATNESNFTTLPAGLRSSSNFFAHLGSGAYFWSSTDNGTSAWSRQLFYNNIGASLSLDGKINGFSVRCLKD